MDVDGDEATRSFVAGDDICQQILTRYARSSAQQHRHLCAAAAAARSIIQASSLDLNPVSYFAAAVTSLANAKILDASALDALTSFLSIVLPLVGRGDMNSNKAEEAVEVLVRTVDECGGKLGTSGLRAAVKSVGILVAQFCNLDEWESVSMGFKWLVKFSIDKRPKVRKSAQDSLLTIFKSFQSSSLSKRASKFVYMLLDGHVLAVSKLIGSKILDGSGKILPEHQDIIHLLNVMKHVVPYLSAKSRMRMVPRLLKIASHHFVALTTHVFNVIGVAIEISGAEVIIPNAEEIFRSLVSYMSSSEKNSVDSVLFAATLSKTALIKLSDEAAEEWTIYLPMITESLAGLLCSDAELAIKACSILRELIDYHVDEKRLMRFDCRLQLEDLQISLDAEYKAIKSICSSVHNLMMFSSEVPNEHVLAVAGCLFLKLGKMSGVFMEHILVKISEVMNATTDSSKTIHLQECLGSAVSAMGPESLLTMFPVSFNLKESSYSNIWLIPILEKHVVGSSLKFFLEHIVPLAKSFEKGSCKVKDSVVCEDLQAFSRGCWALFPAFCRQPTDTCQSFSNVARLLIPLMEDFFIMEKIAVGLQVLIHENKVACCHNKGSAEPLEFESAENLNKLPVKADENVLYSCKTARKNIKALSSNCKEFLQAFTNAFFEIVPESRKFLKDAIGSLVSICDASEAKQIFVASAEKFHLLENIRDHENSKSDVELSVNDEELVKRRLILDLASCFVEGSDEDMANLLFSAAKYALQVSNGLGHVEAYQILSRMLEVQSLYCTSKFAEIIDLLTKMKPSDNIALLQHRFACLQALLIYAIKINVDEESTNAFFILNEIIVTLKDSGEEARKVAYGTLHDISCKLRNASVPSNAELYQKFVSMISGYLSGPSPHIKSGVVSALSVLVYNDPGLCITMPHVFHSVMEQLHSKATEVIKAVLGFVKVLVSSLQSDDMKHLLSDILDGVLRWSSVSRHHFRSKVTVILEIMIRKCGTAAVTATTPVKYKDFVREVVQNRRGNKSSSKEGGRKDTKPEQSDLSHTPQTSPFLRQHKRKRSEFAVKSKPDQSWKNALGRKQNPQQKKMLGKSKGRGARDFKREQNKHKNRRKG